MLVCVRWIVLCPSYSLGEKHDGTYLSKKEMCSLVTVLVTPLCSLGKRKGTCTTSPSKRERERVRGTCISYRRSISLITVLTIHTHTPSTLNCNFTHPWRVDCPDRCGCLGAVSTCAKRTPTRYQSMHPARLLHFCLHVMWCMLESVFGLLEMMLQRPHKYVWGRARDRNTTSVPHTHKHTKYLSAELH